MKSEGYTINFIWIFCGLMMYAKVNTWHSDTNSHSLKYYRPTPIEQCQQPQICKYESLHQSPWSCSSRGQIILSQLNLQGQCWTCDRLYFQEADKLPSRSFPLTNTYANFYTQKHLIYRDLHTHILIDTLYLVNAQDIQSHHSRWAAPGNWWVRLEKMSFLNSNWVPKHQIKSTYYSRYTWISIIEQWTSWVGDVSCSWRRSSGISFTPWRLR